MINFETWYPSKWEDRYNLSKYCLKIEPIITEVKIISESDTHYVLEPIIRKVKKYENID